MAFDEVAVIKSSYVFLLENMPGIKKIDVMTNDQASAAAIAIG